LRGEWGTIVSILPPPPGSPGTRSRGRPRAVFVKAGPAGSLPPGPAFKLLAPLIPRSTRTAAAGAPTSVMRPGRSWYRFAV